VSLNIWRGEARGEFRVDEQERGGDWREWRRRESKRRGEIREGRRGGTRFLGGRREGNFMWITRNGDLIGDCFQSEGVVIG